MTPEIRSIRIADHYKEISVLMRGLHDNEKTLYEKTASWDEIEVPYMRHCITMQDTYDGTCLAAYMEDKMIGFIFGFIDEPDDSRIEIYAGQELYVSDGFVIPEYRRQGIYRLLNDQLEQIYLNKGVGRIQRYTLSTNIRMQRFLESEGYILTRLFYEKWTSDQDSKKAAN